MIHWGMALVTLTLIGMPGAGKSTVGVLLAKRLGLGFTDSDLLIQQREGEALQATLERVGYLALREIEEDVVLTMPLARSLIATGGSVVYSERGMQRLGQAGPVVYLRSQLSVLEQRVQAHPDRGLACPPGQSLATIYRERVPLYERYADYTVDCDRGSAEDVAQAVIAALSAPTSSG